MGDHIVDGEFKSDKYAWCPPGFVALKLTDKDAQPFLWGYAQTHRTRDIEFTNDLQQALLGAGFSPPKIEDVRELEGAQRAWSSTFYGRLNSLMASNPSLSPGALVETAIQLADICLKVVMDRYRADQAKIDVLRKTVATR